MDIDFAKTAKDYAQHRVGFPTKFFDRLEQEGFLKKNCTALDLGTGTGLVAREMALRGAEVVGLDRAGPLLKEAVRLDKSAGVSVRYVEAPVEAMGLDGESFDLIVAGQCWHWFERRTVLQQIKNLLNEGGVLVVAHFDWLPIPESMVEATEKLILKYSPTWELGGGTGLYPHWLPDLAAEGFGGIRTESFDLHVPYVPEDWRGRIRASAGVAASLSQPEVEAFDEELKGILASKYPQTPLLVPHRVWWLTAGLRG
ncbi:MAG: class I SAM-dependent methyltransferase [Planctomycetota bacterium]|nr:class I SAM-dependent methyltransferase [Planctomycetota bacterium]MDA1113408.1 class I SAM-dependent methyltransferase [Planctomycetota bacterium]